MAGRLLALASACFALAALTAGPALAEEVGKTAFRVCQDPNNLPFSNEKGEGIENRIAELFAKKLNVPVEYYSFPQRLGFIRNTLRYKLPGEDFRCDVVLGVPDGWGQVSTTKPYYRSTYSLAFAKDGPFKGVESGDAFLDRLRKLGDKVKVGLYDKSPASRWLTQAGLTDAGVPFPIMSPRLDQYPGEILEHELIEGKLDAVIVWGPIAGFFAKRIKQPELAVVPLQSANGVTFDFPISMGVRHGEPKWRAKVQQLIDSSQEPIRAILEEYGVPLLPLESDGGSDSKK